MRFFVQGLPAPQGDLKGFPFTRKTGGIGVRMVHANKAELEQWRGRVARSARAALPAGWQPVDGPLELTCRFWLGRPEPGARGSKMATEYPIHQSSGDVDKLARAVQDALSKLLYTDDSRVVDLIVRKRYPDAAGLTGVTVEARWMPGYPGGAVGRQLALEGESDGR